MELRNPKRDLLSKLKGGIEQNVSVHWHWNEQGSHSVDWEAWNALIKVSKSSSIFLESRMMLSLMNSAERNIAAVTWHQGKELIGIAVVEDAVAESLNLDGHISVKRSWFSFISRWLHVSEGKFTFRVRVIGPVLGSGLHSYRWASHVSEFDQRRLLTETIFTSQSDSGTRIPRVAMLKDLPVHYKGRRKSLHPGWTPLEFDPEMLLYIDSEWGSLSDYMEQMTTKSRTKIKRVLKVSASLEISNWSEQKVTAEADRLIFLYQKVFNRSGFRLGQLHADELIESKRFWGDDFVVKGYELEGQLVGFQCAYIGQDEVEAFFVGFDPGLVKSHAIYQRMLVEFICLGIDHHSGRVNMGRTALDIKSSVGALPQRLQCDVRFKNPLFHAVVSRYTRGFDPAEQVLKKAWKADAYAKRKHLEIHSA